MPVTPLSKRLEYSLVALAKGMAVAYFEAAIKSAKNRGYKRQFRIQFGHAFAIKNRSERQIIAHVVGEGRRSHDTRGRQIVIGEGNGTAAAIDLDRSASTHPHRDPGREIVPKTAFGK
jgi:hypothetical protein